MYLATYIYSYSVCVMCLKVGKKAPPDLKVGFIPESEKKRPIGDLKVGKKLILDLKVGKKAHRRPESGKKGTPRPESGIFP